METCCISCKKNNANENCSVRRTKQIRLIYVSNCAVCGKKKSKLNNSKTPLSNIPLIGDILF